MSTTLLFKNILSPHLIHIMGNNIQKVSSHFDLTIFEEFANADLETLELKERAKQIAKAIHVAFNHDYEVGVEALIESMKIPIIEEDKLGKYQSFYFMPFSEFIIQFGTNHYDASIRANYALTKVFSAEFSIRPFLINYPEETLDILAKWATDENQHVRRLVSEGTRTRLPWASRLPQFQEDPTPVFKLLEQLKNDPELYVRRSVANNLNDIAKDHPKRVIQTLKRWQSSADRDTNTDWIIKHATRTLVKDGHKEALQLLGFDPDVKIELLDFKVSDTVRFGEKLELTFGLENKDTRSQKLVVDFVLYFKKANGSLAPKVFKLKELKLSKGEKIRISKAHPIKPITTRTYYNGIQEVAVQVNGKELARKAFVLRGV